MKQLIFSNWTAMRFLRLVMGIIIIVQGIAAKDVLFSIAGLLFTTMALFNAGCCAAGTCYTAKNKNDNNSAVKNIEYEEVV